MPSRTGGGADAAGELGEIVGQVQVVDRRFPVLLVNEIVEVRNNVIDGAAAHAERDAAVHAARALDTRLLVGEMQDELAIVLLALLGRFVCLLDTLVFEKSGDLAHDASVDAASGRHLLVRGGGIPSGRSSRSAAGVRPSS